MRAIVWLTGLLIVLPLSIEASLSYAKGWPDSWAAADWSATNTLPQANKMPEAAVRIYAARSGRWKGIFATHHWLVVKSRGAERWTRYDVVGWGRPVRRNNWPADGVWYSNPPILVHELRGKPAEPLIERIEIAVETYPWRAYGSYRLWPGPNSNTFVAHILRRVPQLNCEILPTGIGKDYLGSGLHHGPMPSGTGWQVSLSGLIGVGIAFKEGLEFHFLGTTIGIDFDDLAIKLPGLGKISVGKWAGMA